MWGDLTLEDSAAGGAFSVTSTGLLTPQRDLTLGHSISPKLQER